MKVHLC